jgi:phage terminase small subunit
MRLKSLARPCLSKSTNWPRLAYAKTCTKRSTRIRWLALCIATGYISQGMSKFKSDKMIDGQPERERVERYCGSFVDSGNKMYAYRSAFVVDESKTAQWIWAKVRELEADPEVQARIQAMRDEANAAQIVTVQKLLQDWADIADADPNELISLQIDCCRYCNGIDHAYQWVDEMEYATACAAAIDLAAQKKVSPVMPEMGGGFGFHPSREPVGSCPKCFGRGVVNPMPRDTRRLSPQARKLYAGVKIGANGSLEIKMHDQMKAREQLARVMGYFKDGAIPVTPVGPAPEKQGPMTIEEANRAYVRLVTGKAG